MTGSLQRRVEDAIGQLTSSEEEVALQVAVVREDELLADVAAGPRDPGGEEAVDSGTLFYAASTAKSVASSLAHVLVEAGELSYETRVAEVWPEFAVHGKDVVTLRHILMHSAGVLGLRADLTLEELCDWERMCELIADAEPWWEPGAGFGYHALTFGFLLGELIRRATGKTISAQLRERITTPLGIADEVLFAVPERLLDRVASQQPATDGLPEPPEGSPLARALPAAVRPTADYANRRDVLGAEIPSAGTMSARGAARLYAALLGQVDGVELISRPRLTEIAAPAFSGRDEVMEMPATWAFGYSTFRPAGSRPGSTFGMVGMNGSAAYADIDSGVAVAVMRSRFDPDLNAVTTIDRIVSEELQEER